MLIRYVVVNSVKSETLVKWSCQWIYEFVNFCVWTKINRATFSSCFYIEPLEPLILNWYFYLDPYMRHFYRPHCMAHLVLAISYGPYDLASSETKSKNDDSKHELSENFHQKIIKASCFCRQGTKIEQCSMFDYRLG